MKAFQSVLLLLTLIVIFSIPGCNLFARGEQSTPEKVVEAYLEAFKAGDFETMVRLSGGWRGSTEEEQFVRNMVEMLEVQSYQIGAVDKSSDSEALVSVTVTLALYGHERNLANQIRVIKKGSSWLIEEGLVE